MPSVFIFDKFALQTWLSFVLSHFIAKALKKVNLTFYRSCKLKEKKLLATVVLLFVATALFAKKVPEPEWVKEWSSLYPDSTYVAKMGKAKSANEAKTVAADTIAQYLQTGINSTTSSTQENTTTIKNSKVKTSTEKSTSRAITLSVDISLKALEYTDAWYNKKEKMWYCLAYFERSKAFEMYKSEFDADRNKFDAAYQKADLEEDPFMAVRLFQKAKGAAKEFQGSLDFATSISPSLTNATYASDIENIAQIESKIHALKIKTPLFLTVQNDVDNLIYGAIAGCFAAMDYTVTTKEVEDCYTVEAIVNYNDLNSSPTDEDIHSMTPDVTLSIIGKNGSVYTFNTGVETKTIGYNIQKTKAKACKGLVEKINSELIPDFEKYMEE